MHRCFILTAALFVTIAWENVLIDGFIFAPQFQIFLNQMRENDPNHHQFVVTWDFGNQNTDGFTYATNQFGKF